MKSVFVYTRLSTVDVHAATDRQEAACRSFAESKGWEVAGVFCDVDASAWHPKSRRPGFEAMIDEAAARTCDGLLVWKFDRLVRRPADFERLWDVAERRGVFLASVMEPIDSSTPLGLALLRIFVALAGLESATTGVRIRAYKRVAAEKGDHPPTKAYGLNPTWDGLVESEAAILRESATRALTGERLTVIARDLTDRKIPSPHGRAWSGASLGRMLRNPRLVGDRTYLGEIVARDCWPAILDRQTFDRLRLTLALPERQGAPHKNPRRLATGLVTCGLCGQALHTTTRSGIRYFSCPVPPTGCGRIHVHADRLEAWLLDQLLDRLRTEDPPDARETEDMATTATSMQELANDYYVLHHVGRDEFLSTRATLLRHAEALARLPGHRVDIKRILSTADPRRALGRLDRERVRDLLAERLDEVVVRRVVTDGYRVFDPARLECRWR
jgi:DNA invertase Pin-like site-specific DNA recombinase